MSWALREAGWAVGLGLAVVAEARRRSKLAAGRAGTRGGLGLGLWLWRGLLCGLGHGRGWVRRTAEKRAARWPPLPRRCAAPAPRRGPRSSRVRPRAAPVARACELAAAAPAPARAVAPPRPVTQVARTAL
eukprot:scaffold6718_cov66-Phaeocystis_antarctica.AAC.3